DQDVRLTAVRLRAGVLGEREQPVGLPRHRRHHYDEVVPGAPSGPDAACNIANSLDIGDRSATVFLDDQAHRAQVPGASAATRAEARERCPSRISRRPGAAYSIRTAR